MNYEIIYEDFYFRYYAKVESLIKSFFIKRHNQKKTFGNTINEVTHYSYNDLINQHNLYKNENLKNLHRIFCKRHSIYFIDQVKEIFENEMKTEFDKINVSELPSNYNYPKFIKEVALFEVINEISRLLSVNQQLLKMVYDLNEFDKFEIRVHGNLALEDYPNFKIMHSKLYPVYYDDSFKNEDLGVLEPEITDFKEKQPFKIGLKFATGEPQELYKKYKKEKGHFKMICLELGFKESDRPYFSETLPNTSKSNKNLFNNITLLKQIAEHCNYLQIYMCEDFLEKIKAIELE
jgi:hypothetical protein